MTTIRFQRDGNGGYRTPDGRFTVTPHRGAGGANAVGGYSAPRRGWLITDTSGARPFARVTSTATFAVVVTDTLDRARMRIAAVLTHGQFIGA